MTEPRRPPSDRTPARRRTAFAQTGGDVRRWGEARIADVLADALRAADEAPSDALTHGVHVYPARMHPGIAAALCDRFVRPGARMLDPFCGSGTVLLEAMLRGSITLGVDLNPLALRIAAIKCARVDAPQREAVAIVANEVAEATLAGVRARAHVMAPLSPEERAYYQPHVLRELAVLHGFIGQVPDAFVREALTMVFSAMIAKFSRQRADTSDETVEKHIGKGVPTRFFAGKAEELCERWAASFEALPPDVPAPKLIERDVRHVGGRVRAGTVACIITSPPYVGTYDYVDHHARRWEWLGLRPRAMRAHEVGARRNYGRGADPAQWERELGEVLRATMTTLAADGVALWLVGDGEIAGRRIDAATQLRQLAPSCGAAVVAIASQPRADWRGGEPRAEHLVLLRADGRGASTPDEG